MKTFYVAIALLCNTLSVSSMETSHSKLERISKYGFVTASLGKNVIISGAAAGGCTVLGPVFVGALASKIAYDLYQGNQK